MNRLTDSLSPYLRQHADNPVDWWPWGDEPFAEARRRDVPVLISIGYATCHWCHVMARESFQDRGVAAVMNERFVSVKVDREEHPEVDAAYLTAAGAFVQGLGWPLTIFATPEGRTFFATTYSPPTAVGGHPSFRQVLDAVHEAWTERRGEVDDTAGRLAEALAAAAAESTAADPAGIDLAAVVAELAQHEDPEHGGFGGAPKFPVAPVLLALQRIAAVDALPAEVREQAAGLASRTLAAIAASPLRDPVEGGFFRYGTRRDWSEPHYERMLYDNAQLLRAFAQVGDEQTAAGIVRFLDRVLTVRGGAFGSAQDSESVIDGARSEGGYYALDAAGRAGVARPAVDEKVLTGWNGLAVSALAVAGRRAQRPEWIDLARRAADHLLATHVRPDALVRSSLDGIPSPAAATLEDYGSLSLALLELALATGEAPYAVAGRDLLRRCIAAAGDGAADGAPFGLPGGGDPTLRAQGASASVDPGEGASPSGATLLSRAALLLYDLTGERDYRDRAARAVGALAGFARSRPISMGGVLEAAAALDDVARELVVVATDPLSPLARAAWSARPGTTVAVVTPTQAAEFEAAGFGLFADRSTPDRAYLCEDLVCRLPVADPAELRSLLGSDPLDD